MSRRLALITGLILALSLSLVAGEVHERASRRGTGHRVIEMDRPGVGVPDGQGAPVGAEGQPGG